ncbi:MAG TPA: DUF721 domain-containing protein [Thauera sp.]|nr:DUF721 domain-containing protein [Thauera sp.]HHW63769.1 DUF721 domain-containing protein [Rhodocyclaceae bacterium]
MTRPLSRFLGSGDALARLQDHAARLRRIQGALELALPPQLQGQCQVANLKDGALVLSARGGAAAVRLRQMLPSLLDQLVAAGHAVQTIKVKVASPEQVSWQRQPTERHISSEAKAGLGVFASSLPPDSPLRASLERLIRRGRE